MTRIGTHTSSLPDGYIGTLLGDPKEPTNPTGDRAFLIADEQHELLAPAERLLDRARVNAEFVPAGLGGRLTTADRLGRVLRPLFARDAALGLSYGTSNLIGATSIWAGGSSAQCRRVADLLIDNGLVGPAYTDLRSGNDLAHTTMRARPQGDSWELTGRKEMINNLERCDVITLLAQTGDGSGSRQHSLFLLERSDLDGPGVHWHRRYRTSAVRGLPLAGFDLAGVTVPADRVVGAEGSGFEHVLRGFQLTRVVLPSGALGAWDSVLRMVLQFTRARRLYGRSVWDLAHVRARLTLGFADLLLADALCTTMARALHVLPMHTAAYAPAVKAFVPPLLSRSLTELGAVLGARGFLREGEFAAFQKHYRDSQVATLVHANATVCLATIIPQLPRARRSWLAEDAPTSPDSLFDAAHRLEDLDVGRLRLVSTGTDPLVRDLCLAAETERDPRLRSLLLAFRERVVELSERIASLGPKDFATAASPTAFDCAADYVALLAAAAAVGQLRSHGMDAAHLLLVLSRAGQALRVPLRLDDDVAADALDAVCDTLVLRHEEERTFDLLGHPVRPPVTSPFPQPEGAR